MSEKVFRRVLLPFAVLIVAAALGTFVLGRSHVSASSPSMENPGMHLAASVSPTMAARIAEGRTLFTETCSSCHGGLAQGGALAPSLQGVGSGEIDLWLVAGWMPLRTPESQPEAKPVWFNTPAQIQDVVAYVTSIKPGGFGEPTNIDLKNANVAQGFDMFSLNCAPCHTITGAGDALANGVHAPPLRAHNVAAQQVLEAIRTGPQNMPKFSAEQMSDQQALDLAAFVTEDIQHPDNIGGIGLGGVGPVAEGFIGLFVGVGLCLLAAYWVGDRTERDDDDHGHGSDHGDDDHGSDGADPEEASEPEEASGPEDEAAEAQPEDLDERSQDA